MGDKQASRKVPSQLRSWEARLAAEGLAPLDDAHGMRKWESHNGRASAGKTAERPSLAFSSRADRRHDKRAMDLDSLRQRWRFRTKREREVWRLHCDGVGYQSIAKALRMSERQVRNVFARVEAAQRRNRSVNPAKLRRYIAEADPAVVRKLLAAVTSGGDLSGALEHVEDDAELNELYFKGGQP